MKEPPMNTRIKVDGRRLKTERREANMSPCPFISRPCLSAFSLVLLSAFLLIPSALVKAYPPAPHHLLYGTVRDELGNPITVKGAEVILESLSGTVLKTEVFSGDKPGLNYELKVPMDAGLIDEPYQPTALRPTVPFKMFVKVGSKVYLPIEMVADYSHLGQPGRKTRLNLTLGEDSDGDGIPDAWERALLKNGQSLSDINPDGDADGDGMSNLNEYLTGSYAFDGGNGLTLNVVGFQNGAPILEFTGVTGRTYTVQGSENLKEWSAIEFTLEGESDRYSGYYASDIRKLRIVAAPRATNPKFFRLQSQ